MLADIIFAIIISSGLHHLSACCLFSFHSELFCEST